MGRKLFVAFLIFGFLCMVADSVFTHYFVGRFGFAVEANPAARWVLVNFGLTAFHIQKVILSALGLYLLYIAYNAEGMTRLLLVATIIAVASYAILVSYEIFMMLKG